MKVLAIIVTYGNRFNFLKRVVNSILKQDVYKIIIIDNNSSFESKEKLKGFEKELRSHKIKVFYLNDNYGSAGGYKMGLKQAYKDQECDFIWLLDDDNKPDKKALSVLKEYWQGIKDKQKIFALLSYRKDRDAYKEAVINEKPDLVLGRKNSFLGFHLVDLPRKISKIIKRKLGVYTIGKDNHIKSGKISVAPYGGMFFQKKIIEEIGYPNEKFFLYSDDHDWSHRIIKKGGFIDLILDSVIDDIDTSWNLKEKSNSPFYSYLNDVDKYKVYYSVRNRVYFEKSLLTNDLVYKAHMRLFLLILYFYKNDRNKSQYKMFKRAINDGICNKLGKINE